uniref:Uncharacterized protein n=1 Tax=Anguilla anguilla TaxID=7936 RepID=A0A0E9U149_ANGAN
MLMGLIEIYSTTNIQGAGFYHYTLPNIIKTVLSF